ncbi:hypothetical protein [Streptosporangium roseum]|uniref:hypothetical protein n=1 Tax=Streptosporangium roseum TaxID=2001 RepID=UPI003328B40F
MTNVELAESAQIPAHIVQVQHPGLVDPQSDVCRESRDRVVARGRGELAAGRQFLAPSGEQLLDLFLRGRDAELGADRGSRPIHLIQRALDHPAGDVVQLDPVAQLQEMEVNRQRGRPAGAGGGFGVAQRLAEVGIGVGGFRLPQRSAEPAPDQLQVVGVVADGAVDQPGRGPREHESCQHIGLEVGEFLRGRRGPVLAQIPYGCQRQPAPPDFTRAAIPSLQ